MSIANKLQSLLNESISTEIWYHGRSVNNTEFNAEYIKHEGHNQEGPGFYFTKIEQDAKGYASPNGIVIQAKLTPKKIVRNKSGYNIVLVEKMIRMAPDYEDTLQNWDTTGEGNTEKALAYAIRLIRQSNETERDVFQQVWFDFYYRQHNDKEYINNMIKIGFDGSETETKDHVVIFNPQSIKILNTTKL
jgi:hypothetical protein